jgi:transcriptional regulator with PAS, ATPase and Fis domain
MPPKAPSSPDGPEETTGRRRRTKTAHAERDGFSLLVSCASGVAEIKLPEKEELILGRDASSDVPILDESVSRRHARLSFGASITLEDLRSKNGTTVAGVKVAAGERVPLAVGVVVELGSATLILQRGRKGEAGAKVAAPSRAEPRAGAEGSSEPVVVRDPRMKNLYALLDVVAPSPVSVLVLGETGVGKEVYAEAIHRRSARAVAPFFAINCAALPESMLEAELFGYERGAFTGAVQAKPGLFEAARGGTVFLDEVGEIPLAMQAKLLRVLENGTVTRLGSVKPLRVDVRFVSATNRDLRALVAERAFRADLFFRLNGISITLPALRERTADIAPLAEYFVARAARSMGKRAPHLSPRAVARLEAHAWPGNVRELKAVAERVVLLSTGGVIDLADLERADLEAPAAPADHRSAPSSERAGTGSKPGGEGASLKEELRDLEKQRILDALAKAGGNQTDAAKALGFSRYTLMNRLEAFGLARPRKR